MPRLALCHVCATITRLPDPPASAPLVPARIAWIDEASGREEEYTYRNEDGTPVMVAQYDPALEDWMERHDHPAKPNEKVHDLWTTDQATWQAADVIATVSKEMESATGRMYTERDELKDDAMACFNLHHRPTDQCPDVFSDAKLIGGHESNVHMPKDQRMYLCHACPFVHGYVIPKVRAAKGYYDDQPRRRRRRR